MARSSGLGTPRIKPRPARTALAERSPHSPKNRGDLWGELRSRPTLLIRHDGD
jgi:hypothetical protein